jgi:hypothetical protein
VLSPVVEDQLRLAIDAAPRALEATALPPLPARLLQIGEIGIERKSQDERRRVQAEVREVDILV